MLRIMDPRMPDSFRLFFALWPSESDADRMMAWARDAHRLCGGRIQRQDTLHLTLAFLGATPAEQARALVQAAPAWPARVAPLALRRFGRFTGPRIVWAGPGAHDEDRLAWLDALHETLWSHLHTMGWKREAATFRPHVSLLRRAGPGDVTTLRQPPLIWTPQRCVLVASQPRDSGSYYKVLASMPLKD